MTSTPTMPTLEYLDPGSLIVEGNSREIGDIRTKNPDLVDSVAQHGVLQPVTANPTPDGGRHVRFGFSRTLAAVAAGLGTIPVFVVDDDSDESARLVAQMVENNIRAGYTTSEQAENVERLSLFGLSADEIARQISASSETVNAGLRVRGSRSATKALEENPQLDMLQAAAVAEFDGDEDALDELTDTLERRPDQLDHVVARLRRDRERDQARDDLAEQLRSDGITVLTDTTLPDGTVPLHRLRRSSSDNTRLDSTAEQHATDCAGHAAWVQVRMFADTPSVTYVCRDWRAHGHIDTLPSVGGGASKGPKSERDKLAMRRVKANNKAWRTAVEVRRKWLRDLLRRKEPPKQAQQFLAAELIAGDHELRREMERRHGFACELLNLSMSGLNTRHPLEVSKPTVNQAVMSQLTVVLAAFEASTDVHTWRNPMPAHKRYFTALRDWGYPLSPVERLVLDPDADAADWPGLHDTETQDQGEQDEPTADEASSDDVEFDTDEDDFDDDELTDLEDSELADSDDQDMGEGVDEPTD